MIIAHISKPTPYFLAIAFAGSAVFMSPFCYQTNLMVYGPGEYRFLDYIRAGWILSLCCMITSVTVFASVYHLL
jgi:di/tricarboxylate transporter